MEDNEYVDNTARRNRIGFLHCQEFEQSESAKATDTVVALSQANRFNLC